MANKPEDTKNTFDDLLNAITGYTAARGDLKGAQDRFNTAKAAMESHQRDIDMHEATTFRKKQEVLRVIANLGDK